MAEQQQEPTRPVVAKEASVPVTGTDTVLIACKVPQGIRMDFYQKIRATEGTPSGPREYDGWRAIPGKYFIATGPASVFNPHTPAPPGKAMHPGLVRLMEDYGGYAISPGCPRDLWKQWSKNNSLLVDERVVAAFDTYEQAQEWCKFQRDFRSGLEPIDPERPELTTGLSASRNPLGGVSVIQPGRPN